MDTMAPQVLAAAAVVGPTPPKNMLTSWTTEESWEKSTLIPADTVAKALSFLGAWRKARTSSPCRTGGSGRGASGGVLGGGRGCLLRMNSHLCGEGNENREEDLLRLQARFPEAHEEILVQGDLASATCWKQQEVLPSFSKIIFFLYRRGFFIMYLSIEK